MFMFSILTRELRIEGSTVYQEPRGHSGFVFTRVLYESCVDSELYNIYLANGLHKAKMKNLRHCVSCLAQSSGRGCCCCRGLSVTGLISGSVLHYIL